MGLCWIVKHRAKEFGFNFICNRKYPWLLYLYPTAQNEAKRNILQVFYCVGGRWWWRYNFESLQVCPPTILINS